MKVLGGGRCLIKSCKGKKSTEQYAISRHPMYEYMFCVCTCVCLCLCLCLCMCVRTKFELNNETKETHNVIVIINCYFLFYVNIESHFAL